MRPRITHTCVDSAPASSFAYFQRVSGPGSHLIGISHFCFPEAKFCFPEANSCFGGANFASGKQKFASGKPRPRQGRARAGGPRRARVGAGLPPYRSLGPQHASTGHRTRIRFDWDFDILFPEGAILLPGGNNLLSGGDILFPECNLLSAGNKILPPGSKLCLLEAKCRLGEAFFCVREATFRNPG